MIIEEEREREGERERKLKTGYEKKYEKEKCINFIAICILNSINFVY